MPDKNEKEVLEDILSGVERLIKDTLLHREELNDLDDEIADMFRQGMMTPLRFELEMQCSKRAYKNLAFCIKSLERQKKIAILKLRELES